MKEMSFETRLVEVYPKSGFDLKDGDERLLGVDVFVVVSPRGLAPSKVLPGLGLCDSEGRFVLGAMLPLSRITASAFCRSACAVEKRALRGQGLGPALLLGEWEPRARKMALRSIRCLREADIACFQWTADRVTRDALSEGLSYGAGLALYYGHGRSVGWTGYHGFRSRHLPERPASPLGAVLSITCSTASRGGGGLSFAERLVTLGVSAASLGATRKTRHLSNAYLASSVCEAIAGGATRLYEAFRQARLPEDILFSSYRLFGDPTASLAGSEASFEAAMGLYAPDPDERVDRRRIASEQEYPVSEKARTEDVNLVELIGL
ncbi:hypothetical protein VDG1235_3788 [Verrucomicrobiia bacterium DG1235]|nr:hypothetical protein VDG1235_3788 [Verrucomicrobiae bacterium DG1235]